MYKLRDYQEDSVSAGVEFLLHGKGNGLIVLPTGSGKSLVIANIAFRLQAPVLVLQPNKEILEQNYTKMCSYNVECSMYSASVGCKEISNITFATIGSIKSKTEEFKAFRYLIIDECHNVNAKEGMYADFIERTGCKVLGLTATPYRLHTSMMYGSILKFMTRTRPKTFGTLVHYVQVKKLSENGFLSPLEYYSVPVMEQSRLVPNATEGYTMVSERTEMKRCGYTKRVENIIRRLLNANRKHILVFVHFVEEADKIASRLGRIASVVSGDMNLKIRTETLEKFKSGEYKVIINVGTLTTGFDFPALDTVVLGRPTRSLSLYYQMVGRAIRPYEDKVGWVIDLCDTYKRFGAVEDLEVREIKPGIHSIFSGKKQLTDVYFDK